MYQYNMSADAVGQRFASMSEDAEENGGFQGIGIREIMEGYASIIQAIRISADDWSITNFLDVTLERSLHEDESVMTQNGEEDHEQALHNFRILAAISRQTLSHRVGKILSTFFLSNAHSILEEASVNELILWTHSIYESAMHHNEKIPCLRVIVKSRPEVIDVLINDGRLRTQNLARVLDEMADSVGVNGLVQCGRNFQRFEDRSFMSPSRSPFGTCNKWGGGRNDIIRRPISAPGDRQVAHQADRVIVAADEMVYEAEKLKELTVRY